jgi:hypothetical protein
LLEGILFSARLLDLLHFFKFVKVEMPDQASSQFADD